MNPSSPVIPAKAGTRERRPEPRRTAMPTLLKRCSWVPAFAGMTLLFGGAVHAADLPKARTPVASPDRIDDAGDARAIIALLDRLTVAMAAHDAATLSALVDPAGAVFDTRDNPDGTLHVAHRNLGEWATGIGALTQRIEERIGRPDITISGGVASAIAPYPVSIDGKLHHCGTDHFQLVRHPTGWKIAAVAYNSITEGCSQ